MQFDANGERIPEVTQQIQQYDANGERSSLDSDSAKVEQFRPIVKAMESGADKDPSRYSIVHPATKSGKHALGAYGIVPEFWFKEIGLDPESAQDKKKFLDTPALQDGLFTKIALKGIGETGGDPTKFRAWYYGGKEAVKNIEEGKGHNAQVAYDKDGNEISMPSHAEDAAKFTNMLNGNEYMDPDAIQSLDTRAMAGLPPLPYPNKDANDPANTLYNSPEEQQNAVVASQKQAISNLPIREQMGSGLGAFAYKFPGMGKVAEAVGLAPPGSSKVKNETIKDYNKTRTIGQLGGELLPDVLTSSLGGVGAARMLPEIASNAGRYAAEGATLGGISALSHQAQHLGSGEQLSPKEAAAEVISSATLGTLGGKIGDALKELAPRVLRVAVQPTLSEMRTKNPPNFVEPLEQGIVGNTISKTNKLANAKMKSLEDARALAAKNASQEPISNQSINEDINAQLLPKKQELTPYQGKVEDPTLSDLSNPVEKTSLKNNFRDMVEANKVKGVTTKPQPINGQSEEDLLKEEELARKTFKEQQLKNKLLKDQQEVDNSYTQTTPNGQRLIKTTSTPTASQTARQAARDRSQQMLSNLATKEKTLQQHQDDQLIEDAFEAEKRNNLVDKLKGQRGAIPNPFARKPKLSDLAQPKMQEVRKVDFVNGPLKTVRDDLEKEIGDPVKNKMSTSTQNETKDALDYWESEWANRPTVKGKADQKGTIEDALSFRQAIDREINYRRANEKLTDGFQKGSLAIRNELNKHIASIAPDVGKLTEQEGKILPFKNAINKRVEKNANLLTIPTGVKGTLSVLGGGIGAATSQKGNRSEGALVGTLGGLSIAHLLSTPGGAKLLWKVGKALSDRTTVSKNTLSQLARSSAVKSRDN